VKKIFIKLQDIKISIFGKLLIGIFAILILLSIITAVGITSIGSLERNSKKILEKSIIHNNIHSLNVLANQIIMPVNDYLIHGNKVEKENYQRILVELDSQLKFCKELLKDEPDHYLFKEFPKRIEEITSMAEKILSIDNPVGNVEGQILMEMMDMIVDRSTHEMEDFLMSELLKIRTYVDINQAENARANRLIILLGLLTTISLLIGGFFYVKEITRPIKELLLATQKVSSGDFSVKPDIKTKTSDEIKEFANSFNSMIKALEEKTVSREFFSGIISKMVDSLIVTGATGVIKFVNQTTQDLLGYTEEELIGMPIHQIIKDEISYENKVAESINNVYNKYYNKEGEAIPVIFSRSILCSEGDKMTGMVLIASNCYPTGQDIEIKNQGSKPNHSTRNLKSKSDIPLTTRELEIVKLIAEDYSNKEIARKLFISVRTVETHRKNLMQKLHVRSVISMVHYAVQSGII
jgi:PAS domain S-box-containing protein